MIIRQIMAALLVFGICMGAQAKEDGVLPVSVQEQAKLPLQKVGSGVYSRFIFDIYRATLWAAGEKWDRTKPYALQLQYTHDVDKKTIIESIMDDIRKQNVADETKLAVWEGLLQKAFTDIVDGDEMVGMSIPGQDSRLYFNGEMVARIKDPDFSRAFFNIWLGDIADPGMRRKLLGQAR